MWKYKPNWYPYPSNVKGKNKKEAIKEIKSWLRGFGINKNPEIVGTFYFD